MSADPILPKASRNPADRITDDMLRRPLRSLSATERALIRRANSESADAFMERIHALRRGQRNL